MKRLEEAMEGNPAEGIDLGVQSRKLPPITLGGLN